jgi:phosphomannomutase
LEVYEYAGEIDPSFRGIAPEPTAKNTLDFRAILRALDAGVPFDSAKYPGAASWSTVPSSALDMSLVTDGDSDRIALCNRNGDFIDAQIIFSLALEYLLETRGLRGIVCKTNAVSERIELICKRFDVNCEVYPIGFKYVAARMQVADVLMGGEEAGGLGVKAYLPERDGVMMGLLILERMAREKKSLSALISELQARYGALEYERWDLRLADASAREGVVARWNSFGVGSEISGARVARVDSLDGRKFFFEGGGWLLVRISGTEPVVRLYCEMSSVDRVREVLESAERKCRGENEGSRS